MVDNQRVSKGEKMKTEKPKIKKDDIGSFIKGATADVLPEMNGALANKILS